MTMRTATTATLALASLLAPARAFADDDAQQAPPTAVTPSAPIAPQGPIVQPALPAPPRKTPFDRGRVSLSAGASEQSIFDQQYFEIGAGAGYFVLDGVELGLSGFYEVGPGPTIVKVAPSLRYLVQPLVGKWPIIPYIGAFYTHSFIDDNYADEDTVGGRAGFVYISGNFLLGLGVAVETAVSTCTMGCTWVYPDLSFNLAL